MTSAKSRLHDQLIRAELTSNGSSEPPSDKAFELSSHQKARRNFCRSRLQAELSSNPSCLSPRGSTTAKGLYAKFFFVLYHYDFGGVSALCVLLALSTPLRPRGRVGVFRRREGPASQAPLGHPLLLPLAVLPLFSMRRILTPRSAARGSTLLWIRSPFFGSYDFFLELVYSREVHEWGRTDVFSRPRLSTTSSPLRGSPTLLMSTSSSRASMVWTDTVFGVVRAVAQFEA